MFGAIPMQDEDNEGSAIHDTTEQESNGHDDPEMFEEGLLGWGHKQKKTFILLCDYVSHSIQKLSPSKLTSKPQRSSRNPYPIAHHLNCNKFSSQHRMFLVAIHAERELVTYSEAITDTQVGSHAIRDIDIGD